MRTERDRREERREAYAIKVCERGAGLSRRESRDEVQRGRVGGGRDGQDEKDGDDGGERAADEAGGGASW